jgi:transglutaminase-like putative cysteine protease
MIQNVRGRRGERSVLVRSFTEQVVRRLQPKDYLGEVLAIRNAVAERLRYVNDPLTTEWTKDPERLVAEIYEHGIAAGDCDDIAGLIATMARQVGREAEFVVVGFGAPGHYSHVFARVREPKSHKWIVCDPVAGTNEGAMLRRVRSWRSYRTD